MWHKIKILCHRHSPVCDYTSGGSLSNVSSAGRRDRCSQLRPTQPGRGARCGLRISSAGASGTHNPIVVSNVWTGRTVRSELVAISRKRASYCRSRACSFEDFFGAILRTAERDGGWDAASLRFASTSLTQVSGSIEIRSINARLICPEISAD